MAVAVFVCIPGCTGFTDILLTSGWSMDDSQNGGLASNLPK